MEEEGGGQQEHGAADDQDGLDEVGVGGRSDDGEPVVIAVVGLVASADGVHQEVIGHGPEAEFSELPAAAQGVGEDQLDRDDEAQGQRAVEQHGQDQVEDDGEGDLLDP